MTDSPTRPLKACSYEMTVLTLKDNAFLVTGGWITTTVFLYTAFCFELSPVVPGKNNSINMTEIKS